LIARASPTVLRTALASNRTAVPRVDRARSRCGGRRRPGVRRTRAASRASPGDDGPSDPPPGDQSGRRLAAQPIGGPL
jgi:hypothetical protein